MIKWCRVEKKLPKEKKRGVAAHERGWSRRVLILAKGLSSMSFVTFGQYNLERKEWALESWTPGKWVITHWSRINHPKDEMEKSRKKKTKIK